MTTVEDAPTRFVETPAKREHPRPAAVARPGVWSWFTTVDHKKIAIMYGTHALFFFLVGGIEALFIRLQLAQPDGTILSAGAVQRVLHDARHDDGVPHRHADRRRVRQLPRAADDRRARRRVPAPQHARVLGLPASAGCSSTRRSRSAARPTAAGSATRRSRARRSSLGFLPGHGRRLLGRRPHHARHRFGRDRGQLHRHDAQHARAGHDVDAHAGVRLDDARRRVPHAVRDAAASPPR